MDEISDDEQEGVEVTRVSLPELFQALSEESGVGDLESECGVEEASNDEAEQVVEAATLLRNLSSCLNSGSLEDRLDKLASEGGGVSVEDFCDMSGEVFVVAESVQSAGMAELYDSGCTNHISPY